MSKRRGMAFRMERRDCVGLARPALDAHTLGLTSLTQLLRECGYRCVMADAATCAHLNAPDSPEGADGITRWVKAHGITVLGFSYRLDPQDGLRLTARLLQGMKARRLLKEQGGPVRAVYFAGLPRACALVRDHLREIAATFEGDETAAETLERFGVDPATIPRDMAAGVRYDEDRLAFGRELIRTGAHLTVKPLDRSGYAAFGTRLDTLVARLQHGATHILPPLMRAHVGPFLADRSEAVRLFLQWVRQLASSGYLDVLSIGTSQLSQSSFGEAWGDKPNGGGVPLNSPEEFSAVWEAARPMLVRTYAGTKNIRALAQMYEERINIAWHAFSLWWFCQIDGRGPYTVRENLDQQFAALRYVASTGKPYEPNVSHHFAFRGADDVTCIVAAVLAARTAKVVGIRHLVLQVMLNTPRSTRGTQDLAKARAILQLVREMGGAGFHVILQPRGGLDYFSPTPDKAKAQLAAVTALMDDIQPHDPGSPPIIHVVSYSEGYDLADPPVIDESIKITRHALEEYRRLRRKGDIDDMTKHPDVKTRAEELLSEARTVLRAIETAIPHSCTAEGLFQAFARRARTGLDVAGLGDMQTPVQWVVFAGALNVGARVVARNDPRIAGHIAYAVYTGVAYVILVLAATALVYAATRACTEWYGSSPDFPVKVDRA
ncbi:MAG: cobalamin-binding protein [Verrucomicrobiota bacterium]|nr:cobalamin-binding protein [Verrucomicrobiota bacterium]